ncbi:MAG: hypothetical protein M1823_000749 [Watsoniomyces obsoletus]|nr:MAG: hypothetical protein M1823_000749 [Watsoniomyces obsoletus]
MVDGNVFLPYLADSPPTVVRLEIRPHFDALTDEQRRYAHYISLASFLGTRIILRQVSTEAESIYDLIIALYRSCRGDWKELQKRAEVEDSVLQAFLEYAAQFLGNIGNYKAVGDAKFIPRMYQESFEALASTSPDARRHFLAARRGIYAHEDLRRMHLGYIDDGHVSQYYPDSPTITKEDIISIGEFVGARGLALYNTRLRKTLEGDFDLLIASVDTAPPADGGDMGPQTEWELEGTLKGKKLRLVYGDHSQELEYISRAIEGAQKHAANETQATMHAEYARSFRTGSAEAFKRSQQSWVQDKGPVVESNIGFIESYRDPHGVRAEWEGFVAMVNQERTRAFGRLVDMAPSLIPNLPWSSDFEKDHFLTPDFTSLEVLSFVGSMIPAGINIPNLHEVCQTLGFKNVSLGNVLSAKAPKEPTPFIREADLDVYHRYRDAAFEVQVGIHELLGHGTGKLLQETSPGTYNFDVKHPPISPVSGQAITTWYRPGQSWGSVFGTIASSYEECRAECVAMALCCDFATLQAFGFGDGREDIDGEAGSVLYVTYLQMARAGLASLEYYDPASRKWGQAHAQARFSILRCFLDAGDDFVRLSHTQSDLSDLVIDLDRSKILSHGRPAVERYLQRLHVYKATADVTAGRALYLDMTDVDPDFWGSKVRDEVLRRKTPRKIFVQASTGLKEDGTTVTLREYEASLEGMIQSWAERHV